MYSKAKQSKAEAWKGRDGHGKGWPKGERGAGEKAGAVIALGDRAGRMPRAF